MGLISRMPTNISIKLASIERVINSLTYRNVADFGTKLGVHVHDESAVASSLRCLVKEKGQGNHYSD